MNVKELCVSSEHDEPVTMYLRKQGPGDVTAGDIQPPAGVTVHNPDLSSPRSTARAALDMELTVERGRGYVTGDAEQAARPGDRPDPGRLDLLAGAQGDLPRRGDPRRAAHRLRPADHRRRDQAVDHPADALASAGSTLVELFGLARELDETPRASTSARRRRTRSSPPTWRCRSRSWTSPSARTTASSARASTRSASSSPAPRPTCSTSATSAEVDRRGQDEARRHGPGLKDSPARLRPGATSWTPSPTSTTTTERLLRETEQLVTGRPVPT